MRHLFPIVIFSLTFAFGCNSQTTISKSILTDQEKRFCDSLRIDTTIVLGIRTQTDSSLTPFPVNLEMVLNKDIDPDSNRKQFPGFIFNATNATADNIVINLYNDFQKKGYTIFSFDRNFGINNKSDILGILKTLDKYQILKQVQTDGINWDIDNDSLLNLIKTFDKKYSLDLVGASGDWCEFKIKKEPQNWVTLAKEAYKVCPDIVDQGSGTVEKLAEEMKQTKRLYFWWD
jgi:hypothetical protein